MTSLMAMIRKCYWAFIFIDKHKEKNIFITYTFRTFFISLEWEAQVKHFFCML